MTAYGARPDLRDVLFGVAIHHFCYPYGFWNERVRDLVIEAGYLTATTTQFGLNDDATSPFELRRIMARYQSWGLRSLRQPTLIMHGTDDPIIPLVNARILSWLIRTSHLHVIDDGHLFLISRAREVAPVVARFLAGDAPGEGLDAA